MDTNCIKRSDEKLFLSKEMEYILDSSLDGIWITDGKGIVLYVNQSNERMIGISKEDMLGRNCKELVEKKYFQSSATMEAIKTKSAVTMRGYNYRTNIHVLISSKPILDKQNNVLYVINNVRDETQMKEAMTLLRRKDRMIHEQQEKIQSLLSLQNKKTEDYEVIAASQKMKQVLNMAERVGHFDSTVLILGESGSGKEVIADTIVRNSSRMGQAFVKVNCGAIPENLIESELFGYEAGAFTGASKKGKMGMFELANKGTILLDEIGELPQHLQVKLLRVLQERKIVRVGGVETVDLDIRVLAATNADLEQLVRDGVFRSDLYYRLNVVTIDIPPLRERREDIPKLIQYYKEIYTKKYGLKKEFSEKSVAAMCSYGWPGNIRELQNVIENLVIMTDGERIEYNSLPAQIKGAQRIDSMITIDKIMPLKDAVESIEQEMIQRALEKYGNTRAAAKALGVNQSTVVRKMQALKKEE